MGENAARKTPDYSKNPHTEKAAASVAVLQRAGPGGNPPDRCASRLAGIGMTGPRGDLQCSGTVSNRGEAGTSLLPQLLPVGAGALFLYWKQGYVNWRAGLTCAAGLLLGGYFGSLIALRTPSNHLHGMFGVFLMVSAALLWSRSRQTRATRETHG